MDWRKWLLAPITFLGMSAAAGADAPGDEGIRFACSPGRLEKIEDGMETYLASLGIDSAWLIKKADRAANTLVYTLNTPPEDTNTLDLKDRPELGIREHVAYLPAPRGKSRKVITVSKKEILLALFQHGRLTEFNDADCDLEALKDHVGIRQNTVAWAESLEWSWPDGESAIWNNKYWKRGTPRRGVPLHVALNDVFLHQGKYSIGCYTATKLAMLQGLLDYFRRIKRDPAKTKRMEQRLQADGEPLVGVEPGKMWDFEADFDPKESGRPGKILTIQYGIAPKNFVPGDWVYFLNTDPVSCKKTGYEGSNAIYLGRNKFDDYYNDNEHSYSFKEKLDEVYQWRNWVFSRSRDRARIKPLAPSELERLIKTPAEGGLLTDLRVFPLLPGRMR
ncbi:MAG: hypothetical protein PHX38_14270 [Sulfuricella sp.]|nr:hypothetical protein [Sulfuricella sp.]